MRGKFLCTAVGIVSVLFVGEQLLAHHAFSSEFNPNKVLTLNGTVSDVSWANPHVAIKVAVKDARGGSELWTVHGDSPATLERNGWNSRLLVVGQPLSVCGYEAINEQRQMSGEQVALANGATMLFATTDVKSCLRPLSAPRRQTDNRQPTPQITNPVGAIGNPIGPIGNPVGPVVPTAPR